MTAFSFLQALFVSSLDVIKSMLNFLIAVPLFTGLMINSTTIKIILQKRKTIHFTFRCIDQWTKLRRAVHVNMQMARCTPAPRVSPPPPSSMSGNMDSKSSLGRNEGRHRTEFGFQYLKK